MQSAPGETRFFYNCYDFKRKGEETLDVCTTLRFAGQLPEAPGEFRRLRMSHERSEWG